MRHLNVIPCSYREWDCAQNPWQAPTQLQPATKNKVSFGALQKKKSCFWQKSYLSTRHTALFGHLGNAIHNGNVRLGKPAAKEEAQDEIAAAARSLFITWACKQALAQRAPRHHGNALIFQIGNHFALFLTVQRIVVVLTKIK